MTLSTLEWPELIALGTAGLAFVIALLSYIAPRTKNVYDDKLLEVLTAIKDLTHKAKEDDKK